MGVWSFLLIWRRLVNSSVGSVDQSINRVKEGLGFFSFVVWSFFSLVWLVLVSFLSLIFKKAMLYTFGGGVGRGCIFRRPAKRKK